MHQHSSLMASGEHFICASPAMRQVLEEARRAAASTAPILLTGESGSGKGRVADEIHINSSRRLKPLIVWSAPLGSDSLGLREMYGHVRGAFTGADRDSIGIFEAADGGTLVIDDADKMNLGLQADLLRFMDTWTFRRVGSAQEVKVDLRLIVTVNRLLAGLVREGLFLHDLHWRLRRLRIHVPPLRERPEDIPPMIEYFAALHARTLGRPGPRFSRAALQILKKDPWPGNVRQLSGVLENLVFRANEHQPIGPDDVLKELAVDDSGSSFDAEPQVHAASRHRFQKPILVKALDLTQWNSVRAASTLGISNRTLRRRMQELGLSRRNRTGIRSNGAVALVAPHNGNGNGATH